MELHMLLPFLVFFPMIGGLIGYFIGKKNKKARSLWACLVTLIELLGAGMLLGQGTSFSLAGFCGLGLNFQGDALRILLVLLTAFIWLVTTLFSQEYFATGRNRNRYYFFMLLTLGATAGVFLSADLFTTFIFFELMSMASFVLVMHEETAETMKAAKTYLAVAVIGGLVTLMGLFMMYQMAGTLDMDALSAFMAEQSDPSQFYGIGILILFGFGAKAGLVPLHIWLPGAYTVAPAPASALLSCVLTKTGVFGMIILGCKIFLYDGTWGQLMLVFGVITMVMGAVLAVFSVDLKRTLACSSMSQIGFITIGLGMQGLLASHNALAAGGTILHFMNHSFLKLVLFLSAGVIFMNLHKLNLNEIRGWGKDKPLLKGVFLMGVLGITGIPLWNGYISKTLIHESIVEYIVLLEEAGEATLYMQGVEWLFLFSGGLTIAYMTKIFVAIFIEKNIDPNAFAKEKKQPYMSKLTAAILVCSAVILPIMGMFPHMTLDKLADMSYAFMGAHAPDHAVAYFAWVNLKGAVISLCVGAVVYFLFIRQVLMTKDDRGHKVYVDRWPVWLNLEEKLYRPALLSWLPFVGALCARAFGSLTDGTVSLMRMFVFNDDSGRVIPPEDKYFSTYTDTDSNNVVYREGFARSLLMIGIGLVIAMLYILV